MIAAFTTLDHTANQIKLPGNRLPGSTAPAQRRWTMPSIRRSWWCAAGVLVTNAFHAEAGTDLTYEVPDY